jgi:hypothetical protein
MEKTQPEPGRSKAKRTSRSERLAAALRANLRRRKAQARGRAGESKAAEGSGEPMENKRGGDTEP